MKLLSFAGQKQSGKSSAANFIAGCIMQHIPLIDWFKIDNDGTLTVPALVEETVVEAGFNLDRKDPEFIQYVSQQLWPHIKTYSFADPLKEFCMQVFGLTEEQCYGTNADKNSLTKLKWEDMPQSIEEGSIPLEKSGLMTAREVLQYFGTNIVRKMYYNAWADACLIQIKAEQSDFAVITDCRFPNEVEAVKAAGGRVIYLTRKVSDDKHDSETALNSKNFDHSKFDAIIDNQSLDLNTKNKQLYEVLRKWDWIPELDLQLS